MMRWLTGWFTERLTLKMRITLWAALIVLCLMASLTTAMIAAGGRLVRAHSRDMMSEVLQDTAQDLLLSDGRPAFREGADFLDHGIFLSVYTAGRAPEEGLLFGRIPAGFDLSLPFSPGLFRTVQGGQDEWYVLDRPQSLGAGTSVWIRGALSTASDRSAFDSMIHVALILVPVIMVIVGAGSYLLVAWGFRPMGQMAEAAGRVIDGSDLSERMGLGEGRDELHRLAAAFDAMLERLQASFEREQQFSSDVSHELRTPTAVMISQCEYALEQAKDLDEAKAALSTVLAQAERMSALIGQLLSLSRVGRGREKLDIERIDLSELAELVADQVSESAEERRISIHTRIEPGLMVDGDETMLMRLILNLMENAVRYGREGGRATLTLRRQGDAVVGSVADDGIGIAPEHLSRIWDRLYQVDPARASGGIGLGLPMVRHIAEAHGGSVAVESTLGQGSVFSFTLPLAPPEGP